VKSSVPCDDDVSTPARKVRLINGRKIRVMVLDDHPVVTFGTAMMLGAQQDMHVEASYQDVASLQAALREHPCDVVVADFHLPGEALDGAALVRHLRARYPELAIVVYTSDSGADTEFAVWRAGANAFVCKRSSPSLLSDMVRSVRARPRSFHAVRGGVICTVAPESADDQLTLSELEVMRHLSQGLSVVQVANKIHRSKQTVSSHKRSAMHKLHLADDMSLALYLKNRFAI
jgi:two-component system, NarL family, captular synthesis response regulator RcsB